MNKTKTSCLNFMKFIMDHFTFNNTLKRWEKVTVNRDDENDSLDVWTVDELYQFWVCPQRDRTEKKPG